MLSITEKMSSLRAVSLFAETPDAILAEVAGLLEELDFSVGMTVFEQGDYGDAMYIINEGSVRIHSGGRTLATLEKGAVFGEMAGPRP